MKRIAAVILAACACMLSFACTAAPVKDENLYYSLFPKILEPGKEHSYDSLSFYGNLQFDGDHASAVLDNCSIHNILVLTSGEGTRLTLLESCDVHASLVFNNGLQEVPADYAFPEIILTEPANIIMYDCIGRATAMGDFQIAVNGETYSLNDAELYRDPAGPEAEPVSYDGQPANYFSVTQRWQDGERIILVECGYDPAVENTEQAEALP